MSVTTPESGRITMFTTSWCGYCVRLKAQLHRAGVGFDEVNIEKEPDAADFVMRANKGSQTVPTVLFPDGTTATNPSVIEVQKRLV